MNKEYCWWDFNNNSFSYSDKYVSNLFLIKRNSFIKFGNKRPGYIICKRFMEKCRCTK